MIEDGNLLMPTPGRNAPVLMWGGKHEQLETALYACLDTQPGPMSGLCWGRE